jgi:hypothetical protein
MSRTGFAFAAPDSVDLATPNRWRLAKMVGYLAIIDLLLLPYFQLFIIPLSLPLLILAWPVVRMRIKPDGYAALFVLIALTVLISSAWSIFLPHSATYLAENVKRALQLLSSFVYFFYFRWLVAHVRLNPSPIIVLFVLWFAGLALVFLVKPIETTELLRIVYGRLVSSEEVVAAHFRFPYLFTDPNTAAYFFLIATGPLLLARRTFKSTVAIIAIMGICTLLTQSRGAILALMLMILARIYPPDRFLASVLDVRKAIALGLIVAVCIGAIVYFAEFAQESNKVARLAYDRLFESEDYASGGTRFENWAHIASHLLPLPFGRGYALLIEGNLEYPHSDLLRLVYSYGWISVLPVLAFLFRRSLSFATLVIPAFIAFMINTLIDEQKLLSLFLALLAICVASEERELGARAHAPQALQ